MKKIFVITIIIMLVGIATVPFFTTQTFSKFAVDDWGYQMMMMILR